MSLEILELSKNFEIQKINYVRKKFSTEIFRKAAGDIHQRRYRSKPKILGNYDQAIIVLLLLKSIYCRK